MGNPFELTLGLDNSMIQSTFYDGLEENDDLYEEEGRDYYDETEETQLIDDFKKICIKRGADYAVRWYLHHLSFEARIKIATKRYSVYVENIDRDSFGATYEYLSDLLPAFKEEADQAKRTAGQV